MLTRMRRACYPWYYSMRRSLLCLLRPRRPLSTSTTPSPTVFHAPVVRSLTPLRIEVEEGKTYFWCACGRSQKEPWCDGSHKVTSIRPVKWVAPKSGIASICACRATRRPGRVLCDGAHATVAAPTDADTPCPATQ